MSSIAWDNMSLSQQIQYVCLCRFVDVRSKDWLWYSLSYVLFFWNSILFTSASMDDELKALVFVYAQVSCDVRSVGRAFGSSTQFSQSRRSHGLVFNRTVNDTTISRHWDTSLRFLYTHIQNTPNNSPTVRTRSCLVHLHNLATHQLPRLTRLQAVSCRDSCDVTLVCRTGVHAHCHPSPLAVN